MKNENNKFDILKRLLDEKNLNFIRSRTVINLDNGYELFGEYFIQQSNNRFLVRKYQSALEISFYSLKNAVLWATMHKRNKLYDMDRIFQLDTMLESNYFLINHNKELMKKTNNEEYAGILAAKLSENQSKITQINNDLYKYTEEVKKWQFKQFKELETSAK
jgi:hypothetical protein